MSIRQRCLIYALLVAPLGWLFGGILWRGEVLSFRDIAHYYRPLWEWTTSQWASGRIPLWCPLDGLGMPIHADPTASLFYPGQLVFALPVDFTTRVNLYIIGHLLLAVVLLYRTARALDCSHVGAAAGAISYAYGGHVLFQYCNPIYLVGAAWLPLAALAAHRMLTLRSYRWAIGLAVVLALMVLGGDPQLAGHMVLITALYAILLWREARRNKEARVDMLQTRPLLLSVSGVVAFLLAAIQILPALQWSSQSERAIFDRPRSVWEAITFASQVQRGLREVEVSLTSDTIAGIFATPLENSHHEGVYDFSVGPWRWLEFIWPNIGGRMFPEHRRWMNAIPAEGRIWTPSLYMGLLPLLAACSVFSLRHTSDVTQRWCSWLVILGIVGSLGVYGLGYLWHEVHCALLGGDPAKPVVASPVGGLYWLLVTLLPSYVQFRYPAKLMVLASLGLALLAARGWDKMSEGPRWARRAAITVLAINTVAVLLVAFVPPLWNWIAAQVPPEFPFGEFRPELARFDVLLTFFHTALVAGTLATCTCLPKLRQVWPVILLLLTAIELPVAQQWMIASSDESVLSKHSPLPQTSDLRSCYRGAWSNQRHPHAPFADGFVPALNLAWERESLAERFHLLEGVRKLDSRTALEPADLAALLRITSQQSIRRYELGIDWELRPDLDPDGFWSGVDAWGGDHFDDLHVYAAHRVNLFPSLTPATPMTIDTRTAEVFKFPAPIPTPFLSYSFTGNVELAPGQKWPFHDPWRSAGPSRDHVAAFTQLLSDTIEISCVSLDAEQFVVVTSAYHPDWIAETIDEGGTRTPLTIYRTNRLCMGVMLPPGKQTVLFRYRPIMFYIGAFISSAAWGVVLLTSFRLPRWRKREGEKRKD